MTVDDIATYVESAVDAAFDSLREAGFGFGSRASGFVRRQGSGFGGKRRRAAFFAKLKDGAGKAVRFRKPSAKNLSGATRLNKKARKYTGVKAVTGVARTPLQAKRYALRHGKYYSYASKIGRYGNPRILGI